MRRRATTLAVTTALTTALGLTLAACGDDSPSPTATHTASNGDVYNDADVDFATAMIPHHAQAISMVDMTTGRPLDEPVRDLAEQIRTAQTPEIETMSDWLTSWGKDVPATMRDHSHADSGDGMDDMGTGMPGMMTAEEMDQLQDASDDAFQRMWLQMMIEHHEGAIAMARTEVGDGSFRDAVALAKQIESAQRDEIDRMKALLG